MIFEMLKFNIEQEKKLVKELDNLLIHSVSSERDRVLLQDAVISKANQLEILNGSIPLLIKKISLTKELTRKNIPQNKRPMQIDREIITISPPSADLDSQEFVAIRKKDKDKYLKQLYISESSLKSLRKGRKLETKEIITQYKNPNAFVKLSNKIFLNNTNNLIAKGHFANLKRSLEKGDFIFIIQSYVSMMFFITLISFIASIFIVLFLFFFDITSTSPFLSMVDFAEINILVRVLKFIWIIPALPALVFLIVYFYPSTEKSSLSQKISYELPFATIQMAAIAGADIEPSNIFRIVSLSKEYPCIRKESKKIMNQINLYGYDLINALKNVAAASSSEEWTDLLNGISTTLRSGGDLSKYLNKKAESLLFEYRLKREKSIKAAETFMDIYISVVIAAPMLMMLLLIMMSISGIGFSLSVSMITVIIVSSVSLINLIFLVFLHLNQKKI